MAQPAMRVNMMKKILTTDDHMTAAHDLAEARRNIRRFLKRVGGRYGIQTRVIDHGLKVDRLIDQLRLAMENLQFQTLHGEGRTESCWFGSGGPFADVDRAESGDDGRAG
jgi:hypothetical protein